MHESPGAACRVAVAIACHALFICALITTKVLILTCFMTFPRLLIFAYHWPPEIAGPMVPPEFRELFVIDRDSRPRMSMCKARAYPLIELQIIICGNPNRLRYSK